MSTQAKPLTIQTLILNNAALELASTGITGLNVESFGGTGGTISMGAGTTVKTPELTYTALQDTDLIWNGSVLVPQDTISVTWNAPADLLVDGLTLTGGIGAAATITMSTSEGTAHSIELIAGSVTPTGTAVSAYGHNIILNGGVLKQENTVYEKETSSDTCVLGVTTGVGSCIVEVAAGGVAVSMKASGTYADVFTANSTSTISHILGATGKLTVLSGDVEYANTSAAEDVVYLAPGAVIEIDGVTIDNYEDEDMKLVITYASGAGTTTQNYTIQIAEGEEITVTKSTEAGAAEQTIVVSYGTGEATFTTLVDDTGSWYPSITVSYVISSVGISDITLVSGTAKVSVSDADGTTIYAKAGATLADTAESPVAYEIEEDAMFSIAVATNSVLTLLDGTVGIYLDDDEETILIPKTIALSDSDNNWNFSVDASSYLGVEAEYTEAAGNVEESYAYKVTIGYGDFVLASTTGGDLYMSGGSVYLEDPTYTYISGEVQLTYDSDYAVTVVSGVVAFEADLNTVTPIVVGNGASVIVDGNEFTGVSDGKIQVNYTPSKKAYTTTVAAGTVSNVLTEGAVSQVHGMVFTATTDGDSIVVTVGTAYIAEIKSGSFILAGQFASEDTLTLKSGTLEIDDTFAITGGTFDVPVTISAVGDNDGKIVMSEGAVFSATVTCINSSEVSAHATVNGLVAGSQGIQIYPGSVIITGSTPGADFVIDEGIVTFNDFTIESGAVMTVTDDTEIEGTIINNGQIVLKDQSVMNADIEGAGEIVDKRKNAMEDQEVSGDATKTHQYPANQRIIVKGSWTILKGADVTIRGELEVPEGSKLTVENGASLIIINAKANIYGTLIIENGDGKVADGVFLVNKGDINVYGTVTDNGDIEVTGASAIQTGSITLHEGASFTVGTDGNLTISEGGKVVVEDKATLTIQGESNANTVYNYGTVVFDTKVAATGSSTIYQMGNGAVVDVKNYSIGYAASLDEQSTLTVIDSRLIFTVDKSEGKDIGYTYYFVSDGTYATDHVKPVTGLQDISEPNSIVISTSKVDYDYISTISGLKITEKVSSRDSDDATTHYGKGKIWTNTMDVSGDVKKSSEYVGEATGTSKSYDYMMELNGQRAATVADKLKYPTGITMTVSGYLTVSGELDASAGSSSSGAVLTNSGTITVTGDGIIKSRDLDPIVNASKTLVDSSNKVWHFMTIDKMIAACNADGSKITEFEAVGDNYVTKTASIPAPVKMTVTGNVYIGSEESDIETMLTVKDGTQVTGSGTITVYGTLYAENGTNVKNNMDIISDIKTNQVDEKGKVVKTGWVKWTNLTLALNTAVAGDEIRVTKETGEVWLRSSAEVKEGVTLIIDEDAVPLVLANGVTLTVNGLFIAEQEVYAQSMFDVTAKNENADTAGSRTSAIVVNGEMLSGAKYAMNSFVPTTERFNSDAKLSAGAPIAGAYFTTDDGNVIAGIETAFWMVDEMTGNIKINGAVTTTDAIFAATEECSKIIIGKDLNTTIPTKFTFGTIALLGATIAGESDGSVDGTIAVGDAKVVLKDVTGKFAAEDKEGKLVLTDTYTIETKGKLQVSAGDVYAATTATSLNVTGSGASVASGAKLIANGADATFEYLKVDGTLLVPVNKAFKVSKDLTVAGDVVVEPATATASKGNLSVTNMYVGMSSSDIKGTAATASVSGPFAFTGYVLAHNSATLDAAAKDVVDATKSTEYYVEGKLWFTAYGTTGLTVGTAPISDAELKSWNSKADFTGTTVELTASPAIGTYEALYAKIDYEIYSVTIKTDAGIKEVSIDGKLMVSPASGENQFTLNKLRAGTHKVTYTLMNGYEGTAQLSTKDGTILQNNSFTLSGTETDDKNVTYQLSGTEKQVEPEPVTPEEKSEWTITTILLCVLVVLIAIMAVIVALRLNRN